MVFRLSNVYLKNYDIFTEDCCCNRDKWTGHAAKLKYIGITEKSKVE